MKNEIMNAAESLIGRRALWRLGRNLYQQARAETSNDIGRNGEGALQSRLAAAHAKAGRRLVVFDVGANVGDWTLSLLERARGNRHSTYIQGADHNDFNCCGFNDFTGPAETELGRVEVQQVQKVLLLATVERYVKGRLAAEDLFWRTSESLRPIGVQPTTVVAREYRKAPASRSFVIDDYQAEPSTVVSSSGGAVGFTVDDLVEGDLTETDGLFEYQMLDGPALR